ncbi:hypothetical protein ZEAMMB73_Zm00001d015669 [Zea mays]|uniref:Retrovirus-related Pol polyprotein from transposon TNT 1-94-like beta-barrel domain-containing protein n=1 Tax=Zea mays TaxID=4577 RepID=A0A1D6H359_MAIZE|nr:hypothetical protein ZEAMMB73_Zm00001d015669 [Zea mays]
MDGATALNSREEWHGSPVYVLSTPQPLASDEGSSSSTSTSPPLLWLDSGASHHAVGDARILCNFQDPSAATAVRLADDFRLLVTKVGDIQSANIQIPDVYLVPRLQTNVISVRQLAKSKIIPTFYENHTELWRQGELVSGAIADEETSLYRLYYLAS